MSNDIKVEKGIPIPGRSKAVANKYPWATMEIGDSFVATRLDGEAAAVTRDRANKAVQYAQRSGRKYCTRTVETGIRVWRIE